MAPRRRPPTPAAGETRTDRVVAVLLAVVTVLAYGRVWSLGFVNYDDPPYVSENAHVLRGLGWSGIVWAFTTTTESNWHPITWLSLMLDASIGGAEPRVYHATNLALHVVNALLLFVGLQRMTGARWKSAFVAALFALHPLHVESVAWVAERKDVLSTMFWMLTVAAYLRYVSAPSTGRYATVLGAFALGLMTKPMLVTLPLTLLLLDYWPLGRWKDGAAARTTMGLLREKAPLLALAGLSAIVTLVVQRPAMQVLEDVPLGARIANALVSSVIYIGKMLWPRDLAAIYPYPRTALPLWQPAAAALTLAIISIAAVHARRVRPWLAVGWFFYLVTLLPVSGLVQVGYQARADRYTYVPLIGLFIVVAWGVPDLLAWIARRTATADSSPTRPHARRSRNASKGTSAGSLPAHARLLAALATIVVVALAARTWDQVGHWRSSVDLFVHAVAVTASNAYAHYNLATAYRENGDVDRAIIHLREALRVHPRMAEAHYSLTRLMMRKGNIDEAASLVRAEQALWPSDPHTFVDLGVLAVLQGRKDEAIKWFREALRLSPDLPDARHNLEVLLAEKNQASSDTIRAPTPPGP